MKIYKVTLDPKKPTRNVLGVPANTERYGIAVSYENAPSSLECQMLDGTETLTPTKKLPDGSYLFELSSGVVENDREVVVSATAEPIVVLEASTRDIMEQAFTSFTAPFPAGTFKVGDLDLWGVKAGLFDWDHLYTNPGKVTFEMKTTDQTNFSKLIAKRDGTITFYKADGSVFADDEEITIGQATSAKVAKGGYFARETFTYHYAPTTYGKPMSASHVVILNEGRTSNSDGEIQDDIVFDGVKYMPTSIAIDGTTYKVLAAVEE